MYKLKFNLIILSIFLVYTQGLWERLLQSGDIIKNAIDALLLLAVLINFKYSFKVPGSKTFLWLLLIAFISSIGNSSSLVSTFLYVRYIIFAYLIFHQLYITRLKAKQLKLLLRTFYFLVIIQGFGAAFNLFVLNISVEGHVGIMSSRGGTTAASFPLLIIGLLVLFFLINKNLNRNFLTSMLFLLTSSSLVTFQSGKRAIYILLPLITLIIIFLAWKSIRLKRIRQLAIIIICLMPVFFYGIANTKGFNYELIGGESYFEIANASINYAESYESATGKYGGSSGRTNTTVNIINNSLSDIEKFFFGSGFGIIKDKSFLDSINVNYGVVGFTNTLVSGGWLFTIMFIAFMFRTLIYDVYKNDSKSKLIIKTITVVFIIIHFSYSSDFFVTMNLTFIVMTLLPIIKSPLYADYKHQLFKFLKII